MKSWKTTVGGAVTAVGVALGNNDDHAVRVVGQVLSIVGPLLVGLFARDNNVTSEQAGAPATAGKTEFLKKP